MQPGAARFDHLNISGSIVSHLPTVTETTGFKDKLSNIRVIDEMRKT